MFIINGEQWRVMFVPANYVGLLKPNGDFAIGACDDYTKTIYLNNNLYGDYFGISTDSDVTIKNISISPIKN